MPAARVGCAAAALALVALVGPAAERATAACHAFGVSVAPASPSEGASVTATITRDGAVGESSVRLRTVDGTAKAGQDYDGVDTRVQFVEGRSTTVTIATRQDGLDEPTETFTLQLSEGAGCTVNPNFSYGAPATVSIQDDDSPPAPPPPPTPPTPPPPPAPPAPPDVSGGTGGGVTPPGDEDGADPSVPDEPDGSTTTDVTIDGEQAASDDEDDGGGAAWVVAALAIASLAGAGGYVAYRRRPAA